MPLDLNGLFAQQRRLVQYIDSGTLGPEVIDDLFLEGDAFEFEHVVWDYKVALPDFRKNVAHDPGLRRLVKSVVALSNSLGGYILAGVRDSPREVVGFDGHFNCDAFRNILDSYAKTHIPCAFSTHNYRSSHGSVPLALLHVPRRPPDVPPGGATKDVSL